VLAEAGHRVGQGQRGPLPLGEERGVVPGRDGEEAAARLAVGERLAAVHVGAERAAVHHRRAEFDQFVQGRVDVLTAVLLHAVDGAVRARGHLGE